MKILILSNGNANYATKRLVETAEKRGHKVKVLKYKNAWASIDLKDPWVKYNGKIVASWDAIIPQIANNMTRYGTAILRQLESQGIWTMRSSIAISRARDKLRSMQLMARAGIPMPKTVVSRNADDIDEMIEDVGGTPVIIKLATGTHGNGVVLAETKKAAKSVLQALYMHNEDGTNILIQEFIKEAEGSDIRAFVVGGRVVASMKRQSLDDDFRSNFHKGGTVVAVKLTDEERKIAIKAAKAMGLSVAGVDLMRSDRGPLVLEVNASPGFEALERAAGRDVAGAMIEYVEQNAKRGQKRDKIGA